MIEGPVTLTRPALTRREENMVAPIFDTDETGDAVAVLTSLVRDVHEYFAQDVTLMAAWVESSQTVCVVYRRRNDPGRTWGRRFRFPPHATPGSPTSSGAAFAEFLTEPAASALDTAQTDNAGITWLLPAGADRPASPYA